MAHYKAADSKREQFRRYLEKSGVLDTLTKASLRSFNSRKSRNRVASRRTGRDKREI
uniref:MYC binding protein n=1 Tax=Monodelphis domestica TaxID=13616 RepID=A0A5F8GUR9_MONDO